MGAAAVGRRGLQTLLIAAQAMGYGANWITDWYAYDADAAALLGLAEGERVAGYVHIGTPAEPPLERVRPDVAAIADGVEAAGGVPVLIDSNRDAS